MAAYRVDFFVADPDEVRRWIDDNVPTVNLIRTQVFTKPYGGSFFVAVFNRKEYADAFERHWGAQSAGDMAALPEKWKAWAARQEAASRINKRTNET